VHVLGLTGARAALVYLALLFCVAVWAAWSRREAAAGRVLALAAAALATYLLLPLLSGPSGGVQGLARLAGGAGEDQRIGLWQSAWQMFRDAPMLGQGFGQFGYRRFLAASGEVAGHAGEPSANAHNLVLHVAAEFGAAGLLALIAPVVFWVRGMLQRGMDISTWWIWTAAAVLLVHSLIEYPLWYAYFLGMAALLLGLGEARPTARAAASPRAWAMVAGVAVMTGWLAWTQMLCDYLRMEDVSGAGHAQTQGKHLPGARAAALLELDRSSLLAPYAERALARMISLDRRGLDAKLALNGHVMRAFANEDLVYRQAILLALRGDAAAAGQQWDRAVAAYPHYQAEARALLQALRHDEVAEADALLQHVRRLRSAAVPSSTSKD